MLYREKRNARIDIGDLEYFNEVIVHSQKKQTCENSKSCKELNFIGWGSGWG